MKTLTLKILLLALTCLSANSAIAKLNVVATTPELGAIAKTLGGDKVDLTVLARATEDPHFVDAKPSYILKLNRADALVEGGAELEIGWLPALLDQSRNPKIAAGAPGRIPCNQGVQMLEIPTTLDRSKGDIHAAGNPHFMMDPINAKIAAEHIAEAYVKLDAASATYYQVNLKTFTKQLDDKLVEWQKKLAPFKGQRVVSYHNSWIYFANRFGLNMDLFLEPKPGIPPSPTHLTEVINSMKKDKTHAIFVEPYLNRRTAEKVAGDSGATMIQVAQFPGGVKGTESGYIALMDYLVNSLAEVLSKP